MNREVEKIFSTSYRVYSRGNDVESKQRQNKYANLKTMRSLVLFCPKNSHLQGSIFAQQIGLREVATYLGEIFTA